MPALHATARAAVPAYSGPERRRFPRVPLTDSVTVLWAGPKITACGHDVGGKGISFYVNGQGEREFARAFEVGACIRLVVNMPDTAGEKLPVNVVGEVVRVEPAERPGRILVAVNF